ncbi:RES domain-containing protein [Photobacterium leiognathi]|uniref:RES domain-containing protein n=1 Tax=Photobacterium leiognathi TaxID=553611 RepID=UPI0029811CD0|nr:RES domain-containing protein [Photobacterium leiognathi]
MKNICIDCIDNSILREHLLEANKQGSCSYCDNYSVAIIESKKLIEFAGNRLLESLYPISEATPYESGMFYEGSDDIPFKEIIYIIQDDLDVGNEDFEDELANYIYDNSTCIDDLFTLDDGEHDNNSYRIKWSTFINSIANKHRFFNKDAKTFLDSLFELILDNGQIRTSVITTLDCTTDLYRARVANSDVIRKQIVSNPASQLGAVPPRLAGEQRMTPTGISSLYCALERETCFSEVRAITGDIVLSGAFRPTEALNFLDLTKIHTLSQLTTDPFSEHYSDFSNKSAFIRSLMFLMSKPASRNQSSDYLSTQVIFEYLSVKFGSKLSGLIFKSVQTGGNGTNVVFFPETSDVLPTELCFEKTESVSEYHSDFGECKFYFYSIEKSESEITSTKKACGKLQFVDGSLVASEVKAVLTKTEDIPIEVSVK